MKISPQTLVQASTLVGLALTATKRVPSNVKPTDKGVYACLTRASRHLDEANTVLLSNIDKRTLRQQAFHSDLLYANNHVVSILDGLKAEAVGASELRTLVSELRDRMDRVNSGIKSVRSEIQAALDEEANINKLVANSETIAATSGVEHSLDTLAAALDTNVETSGADLDRALRATQHAISKSAQHKSKVVQAENSDTPFSIFRLPVVPVFDYDYGFVAKEDIERIANVDVIDGSYYVLNDQLVLGLNTRYIKETIESNKKYAGWDSKDFLEEAIRIIKQRTHVDWHINPVPYRIRGVNMTFYWFLHPKLHEQLHKIVKGDTYVKEWGLAFK